MARWPGLWRFPVSLAHALEKHVPCPADRDHLVCLAEEVLAGRTGTAAGRTAPDRVARCVGRRMTRLVTAMARLLRPGGGSTPTDASPFRSLLPRDARPETLRRLAETLATTPEDGREWLHFLHGAIDAGVFEPTVPHSTRLWGPRRASTSGSPPPGPRRRRARSPRAPVQREDVTALEAACQTDRPFPTETHGKRPPETERGPC